MGVGKQNILGSKLAFDRLYKDLSLAGLRQPCEASNSTKVCTAKHHKREIVNF